MNAFRDGYRKRYGDTDMEEDDDNLVVRSFTDDPEIPLRQIHVSIYMYTCSVYVYIHMKFYVHMYIYMYMYVLYVHVHIYMYVHTQ